MVQPLFAVTNNVFLFKCIEMVTGFSLRVGVGIIFQALTIIIDCDVTSVQNSVVYAICTIVCENT
jgi:hypothetical protein